MANDTVRKSVDDSGYEVNRKYRLVDVARQVTFINTDGEEAMPSSTLLDGHDLEQMLNAYFDERGIWNLNVNSSFYAIGIPDKVFSAYVLPANMHWPTVSYKIYGTTRLAWLLMKLNNVSGPAIFKELKAGTAIRYLDKGSYVEAILASIQESEGEVNGE